MKIYNTLTRQIEEFIPRVDGEVTFIHVDQLYIMINI